MNTNFSIRKSDTAVILFMGAFLAFACPQTAEAMTFKQTQQLEACQIALSSQQVGQNFDSVGIDYLIDKTSTQRNREAELEANIDWFLSQDDPKNSLEAWAKWIKTDQNERSRLMKEYGVSSDELNGKINDMLQEARKQIKNNDGPAERQAIADAKDAASKAAKYQKIQDDLAGYDTAVDLWEAEIIKKCGRVSFQAGSGVTFEQHKKCVDSVDGEPSRSDYEKGGKYYKYNYLENAEVEVDSIDDLLNHPAYVKMDAETQTRMKSELEALLTRRNAGEIGGTSIRTISHDGTGKCEEKSCVSFKVYRKGASASDKMQMKVTELATARNIPESMTDGINSVGQLVVKVTKLSDLDSVTGGSAIKQTLTKCMSVSTPGSICTLNDNKYSFQMVVPAN